MLQFNEFLVASFQYNLFSWSDKILFQQKKNTNQLGIHETMWWTAQRLLLYIVLVAVDIFIYQNIL